MSMCWQEELLEMMNENQDQIQQKENEVEDVKLTLKSLQVKLLKVEGGGDQIGPGPRSQAYVYFDIRNESFR